VGEYGFVFINPLREKIKKAINILVCAAATIRCHFVQRNTDVFPPE